MSPEMQLIQNLLERQGLLTTVAIGAALFLGRSVWPWLRGYADKRLELAQQRATEDRAQLKEFIATMQASIDTNRAVERSMDTLNRDVRSEVKDIKTDVAAMRSEIGRADLP